MDVNHLRYVAAIAQNLSFSKAAEQLFISQSSLSQQINKLEKEIGYPLFVRTTKSVRLTQGGGRAQPGGRQALAGLSAGEPALRLSKRAAGPRSRASARHFDKLKSPALLPERGGLLRSLFGIIV